MHLSNTWKKSFSFGQEAYTDYRGNALSQLLFGNDPANNPSYLCSTLFNQLYNTGDPRTFMIGRCYYDGLMSSTSPDNRIDLTNEMLEKGSLSSHANREHSAMIRGLVDMTAIF